MVAKEEKMKKEKKEKIPKNPFDELGDSPLLNPRQEKNRPLL